ncbi:MAG: hypothetical protein Fur0037_20170 [Planctomycetota bacterium]
MVPLADLWLPILLSAVFVFAVSSVVHMVLPLHRGDYGRLPQEDRVLEAMRASGVVRGDYRFPHAASMKDMGSKEMAEKWRKGPVGTMTILPDGMPAIGRSLVQWFAFSLVVGVVTAYAARLSLARGADFVQVLRITAAVSFLAYGLSHAQDSIWKGVRWTTSLKYVFDGILYGIATGLSFGWFWPAA